jgi:hypothetical protein
LEIETLVKRWISGRARSGNGGTVGESIGFPSHALPTGRLARETEYYETDFPYRVSIRRSRG